jgi:hypothetical protein
MLYDISRYGVDINALIAEAGGGGGNPFDSVTIVKTAADFPAPSAGVITLAAGTIYLIDGEVDLGTDRLSGSGGIIIHGLDKDSSKITTTSASPTITTTSGSVSLRQLYLENTGAGKAIDYTGSAGALFTMDHCVVVNGGSSDTLAGGSGLACVIRNSRWTGAGQGLTISGAWTTMLLRTVGFLSLSTTATGLKLATGMTSSVVDISQCQFITGDAGETMLDIDAGIAPSQLGSVAGCFFVGPGTKLGGLDYTNPNWWFDQNRGLEDSAAIGGVYFDNNSSSTSIASTATFYSPSVTGGWALDSLSERYVEPVDGELRYNGKEKRRCLVEVDGVIEPVSGTNKTFQVRVRHYDDSAATTFTLGTHNIDYRNVPVPFTHREIVELETNDYLYVEIRNTTDTTNLILSQCHLLSMRAG